MIGALLCWLGLHVDYRANNAGGHMCPRCHRGTRHNNYKWNRD